ncbi:MAG: hypothetical protein AAB316_04035 [Bacteroidota bacterium]
MSVTEDYLDVLQNIEFGIVQVFKENPQMRDPEVIKALEAATRFYQRKKKGFSAQPVSLTGNSLLVFQAVTDACEWRREKAPGEPAIEIQHMPGAGGDVPIPILVRCLEKLTKSANFWFKNNGQRGYLNYISEFVR